MSASPPAFTTAPDFDYRGWPLSEAIDALIAYDQGATDSGIGDDDMRDAVRKHLESRGAGG